MKKSTFSKLGMLVAGGWLASNVAWGGPPPEPPRQGGIPQCEESLLQCDTDLTQCTIDLAICEATAGQAFPATGQTSCWDSLGEPILCTGTGHDGDTQAGADLSYTDAGLTIIDNNTKLEWMKQDDNDSLGTGFIVCDPASYPDNLDKDCVFSWDEAFAFVASLNDNDHAGGGWRVPNVKELQSIINYGNPPPAVSAVFDTACIGGCTVDDELNPCSCTAMSDYWSSTTYNNFTGSAWLVDYFNGFVGFDTKVGSGDRGVRAVRGGL